ncbi:MAG: hypothetical protein FWG41_06140 [Methanomassiliicoccaceae archaeon]|nr:hypothetical protein [Methanomassiliicoccaceae archaeon]
MKIDKPTVIAIVLCLAVVFGEFIAYSPGMHTYSAEAERNGDSVDFQITSSVSSVYSAVAFDNGGYAAPLTIYIYKDESYYEFMDEAVDSAGISPVDIGHAADQMVLLLGSKGIMDSHICDSSELAELMAEDGRSKGLVVLSYALPESIYSGNAADPLFRWLSEGGSLYWLGGPIGRFYTTDEELVVVDDNQELFFGKKCINPGGTDIAFSVIDGDGLTDGLYLKWNRVAFALNTDGIPGAKAIGFSQDGYSSVSMVPYGGGMVCVFGGACNRNLYDDATQVIASGVSCYSEVIEIKTGTVNRTVHDSIDTQGYGGNIVLYVSIGGYYTIYGRAIHEI